MSNSRKPIALDDQARVLADSRRRCCICFGIKGDSKEKAGQIAHLNKDSSDNRLDNLAYLCFEHHDVYDSTTSQSKNYTRQEVMIYRKELYEKIRRDIEAGTLGQDPPSNMPNVTFTINANGGSGGSSVYGGAGGGGGAPFGHGGEGGQS